MFPEGCDCGVDGAKTRRSISARTPNFARAREMSEDKEFPRKHVNGASPRRGYALDLGRTKRSVIWGGN